MQNENCVKKNFKFLIRHPNFSAFFFKYDLESQILISFVFAKLLVDCEKIMSSGLVFTGQEKYSGRENIIMLYFSIIGCVTCWIKGNSELRC